VAESLLALRDIQVVYGNKSALQILRLDVHSREVLALLGPNGAGKTTLLKVMGLLQPPYAGKVYFHGSEAGTSNAMAIRRRIATVFQEPLLLNVTVYQNAALGLRLRGLGKQGIEIRLRPWLERLGIAHLSERSARTLSGGEAQRTSLARALVLEPEVLLLDEPFAALDPASRTELLRDFHRIVEESKITTVFVTHDRDEAFTLAKRVGVLKEGRLLQLGPREDVFLRPQSPAVAEIVGIENCLGGVVEGWRDGYVVISADGARIYARGEFRIGMKVVVCLRADDITLHPKNCETQNRNRLNAKIMGVSPGMVQHRVMLESGALRLSALMNRKEYVELAISEGDGVTAVFSPDSVHVVEDDRQGYQSE
jgi:tungstate transport system ATP-binding protein